MFNNTELRILDLMLFRNDIPSGVFQIEEKHLLAYMDYYNDITKGLGDLKSKSNTRLARKLAGRTLLKRNLYVGAKFSDVFAGMVYVIENTSFPDFYKIGMTLDVVSRLSQYQTYDPLRRYKIVCYEFVLNRRDIEKQLLSHPDIAKEEIGEWVSKEHALTLFTKIAR